MSNKCGVRSHYVGPFTSVADKTLHSVADKTLHLGTRKLV